LPSGVARRLGLRGGRPVATRTANGVATRYAVRLGRVSVGAIELQDVAATIAPGLDTQEVLLGMSFLKHIEFTQRGDSLILRQ
ncbi:MAG: TIGR02281 family clan AA aspartic protease, partial [Halioglobus sp.]|nr:TIGR02281 family clan AA aspartic protease [Halioglobus sp.]